MRKILLTNTESGAFVSSAASSLVSLIGALAATSHTDAETNALPLRKQRGIFSMSQKSADTVQVSAIMAFESFTVPKNNSSRRPGYSPSASQGVTPSIRSLRRERTERMKVPLSAVPTSRFGDSRAGTGRSSLHESEGHKHQRLPTEVEADLQRMRALLESMSVKLDTLLTA